MQFPNHVSLFQSTPEWSGDAIPKGLFAKHHTSEGVWAKIHVLRGQVRYVIDESGATQIIGVGQYGVIVPKQYHHIEFVEDHDPKEIVIRVDFYR